MAQDTIKETHPVTLTLAEPLPGQIDAGASLHLKFAADCAEGCDLKDHRLDLVNASGQTISSGTSFQIAVTAPETAGSHHWSLVHPRQEDHAEAALPIAFQTVPHETSLAAWDIPSPVVMDKTFTVTVGATCTNGCLLAGRGIEIYDAAGQLAGAGALGQSPWPQTKALYWTQIQLRVPSVQGRAEWSLRFAPSELKLPHDGTSLSFGAQIVPPAAHTVLVKVVEKDGGAPLENAQVRLGVYAAATGADGIARLRTPAGTYELDVLKPGHDAEPVELTVTGDSSTEIAMTPAAAENPYARWYLQPGEG